MGNGWKTTRVWCILSSHKAMFVATCFKLLRSLNQKSGIHYWWVTQPHTVYSMDCWQDLVRNLGFPLKFMSFLWLSPTISLELSWNLQHPLPTSRKELYFTAPAGAAEIKRAWLLWPRKILLSHLPLNATYKYDAKFQRNILNIFWESETLTLRFKSTYVHMNVDTIWYDISDIRLDIDYTGRIT